MMQAQDFPLISHSPKRWAAFVRSRTPILESIVPLYSRGWRNWKALGNDTFIAHVIWRLADEKIARRKELEKADRALYEALRKRKLLDEVGLKRKHTDWAALSDGELVKFACQSLEENGIRADQGLVDREPRLYSILRRRGLLAQTGRKENPHRWARMDDEKLVEYSKGLILENGWNGRRELFDECRSLYSIILRRGLLDAIFSEIESSRHTEAVDAVIDALDSFGDDE